MEAGTSLTSGKFLIKVQPLESTQLTGVVQFDNIEILRMPRLGLSTPLLYNIVQPNVEFPIICTAMGISELGSNVLFEVRDGNNRKVDSRSVQLVSPSSPTLPTDPPSSAPIPAPAATIADKHVGPHFVSTRQSDVAVNGEAVWKLTLPHPGLYRVRVNLGEAVSENLYRDLLVGVMEDNELKMGGPFGWSVPPFDSEITPQELLNLVRKFGVGWVKLPVWFDKLDDDSTDQLVALVERLQSEGVQCVGRLDGPPPSQRALFGEGERLYAATIFRYPQTWEPLLEPVLTRMGMKISWFQLGEDKDTSFMGNPNMEPLLTDIRDRMQTYCQELNLTTAWTWLDEPPTTASPPWNSLHFNINPQLTADELAHYVNEASASPVQTWVDINPLTPEKYQLLDRIRDLTERMITIKKSNITAAFVANPFDPKHGLFTENRTVGEMLLPWRTLVSHLGNATYVGGIQLPNASINHIFESETSGTMILWNDVPTTEQLFLGETIDVTDIWGKSVDFELATSARGTLEQKIQVGPWPLVVHGVDVDVARFRQQVELKITNLASRIGTQQTIPMTLVNTLANNASGRMALISDSLLTNGAAQAPVQIQAGQSTTWELPINIRSDAPAGMHSVRLDFDFTAGKPYHFSVYRKLTLGTDDIKFLWEVVRMNDNQVELRVELINNTDEAVSFDCKLFPPGESYQRFQVLNAKPGSTRRELIARIPVNHSNSKVWIRCEQIDRGRILNYRVEM
jgi:hypothetical protein